MRGGLLTCVGNDDVKSKQGESQVLKQPYGCIIDQRMIGMLTITSCKFQQSNAEAKWQPSCQVYSIPIHSDQFYKKSEGQDW